MRDTKSIRQCMMIIDRDADAFVVFFPLGAISGLWEKVVEAEQHC
jgi:hypothetical protein